MGSVARDTGELARVAERANSQPAGSLEQRANRPSSARTGIRALDFIRWFGNLQGVVLTFGTMAILLIVLPIYSANPLIAANFFRIGDTWLPAPIFIPLFIFGAWFVVIRWLPHRHRKLGREARLIGIELFTIGTNPLSRTLLLITPESIAIWEPRADVVWATPYAQVEYCFLAKYRTCVFASIFVDGEWVHLDPIIYRVGGPVTSSWSWGGALGRLRLVDATKVAFERLGYRVSQVRIMQK